MSSRTLGVIFLKLMGLYLAFEATASLLEMAVHLFDAPVEGYPMRGLVMAASLTWVLVTAGFSALCLFGTKALADWMFGDGETGSESPPAIELLSVGLV